MRYLTLEQCKAHAYIDHNEDDALVELYATAAEDSIENYLECPLSDFEESPGVLPSSLTSAMLLFFATLYANREGFSTMASQPSASILALVSKYKRYGRQSG